MTQKFKFVKTKDPLQSLVGLAVEAEMVPHFITTLAPGTTSGNPYADCPVQMQAYDVCLVTVGAILQAVRESSTHRQSEIEKSLKNWFGKPAVEGDVIRFRDHCVEQVA